ncbi:thioredoxin [bacterium]|nr:thioredoxin [bacterium]
MAGNVGVFDDANFKTDVLDSDVPVLVDFWAEWCAPCHMITPVVEKLSIEYEGRVKFGKLNVDDAPNTAAHFMIRAIPTLLILKGGAVAEKIVGVVGADKITKALDGVLS